MRAIVFALFSGFSAYAFVLRSAVLKLTSGDAGLRGVTRDRGALAFVAGLLLVPAWLAVGAAPMASIGEPWLPGLGVASGGVVLAVASQWAMGSAWRIGVAADERTALVTRGPFRWVRNPFFTGMALVAAGTTASYPSWIGMCAAAVLFATLVIQVRRVEEPHLLRVFGEEYALYARRTGRFVPGLGTLR